MTRTGQTVQEQIEEHDQELLMLSPNSPDVLDKQVLSMEASPPSLQDLKGSAADVLMSDTVSHTPSEVQWRPCLRVRDVVEEHNLASGFNVSC